MFASNQSPAVRFHSEAGGETGRKKGRRSNPYFWKAQMCHLVLCGPGSLFISGSTITIDTAIILWILPFSANDRAALKETSF